VTIISIFLAPSQPRPAVMERQGLFLLEINVAISVMKSRKDALSHSYSDFEMQRVQSFTLTFSWSVLFM